MLAFNNVFGAIIISCAIVVLALIIFLFVRSYLRARFFSANKNVMGPAFTFEELQHMLKKGLISKEEFETLRKMIIEEHESKN